MRKFLTNSHPQSLMDSVTHGSVSVLIGLIFIQFYKDTPLWLLILVMFVFGVLIDYDHVFFYKRKFPDVKIWNLPQLIKVYFKTLDEYYGVSRGCSMGVTVS